MDSKDQHSVIHFKMKKYLLTRFIMCGFALFLIASCNSSHHSALPYYNEASFTPIWLSPDSPELESIHKIPQFSLTNQDGKIISEQTFKNSIYITDFFFTTCPGICLDMTANMSIVQDSFLTDSTVLILSHSVTPVKDSVSVLQRYAKRHGVISDKWHLVTGSQSEIYHLGRKEYFVEEDLGYERDEDEFLHTENFVLIDKNRHIRGIYNGLNKTAIQQLIADVRILQIESKLKG